MGQEPTVFINYPITAASKLHIFLYLIFHISSKAFNKLYQSGRMPLIHQQFFAKLVVSVQIVCNLLWMRPLMDIYFRNLLRLTGRHEYPHRSLTYKLLTYHVVPTVLINSREQQLYKKRQMFRIFTLIPLDKV